MMHEKILFRLSGILSIVFVVGLIYLHFFGWFYPKNVLLEETQAYLLQEGYSEEDILHLKSCYDYKADNKYYVEAELLNEDGSASIQRFGYDVEENIYKLGEK